MPSKPRNRIGEIYGKLTVIRASDRRTKSGNAYWWCRCSCGRDREVPGDKLSTNLNRRKPVVTACLVCSKELQVEGVCAKNDREERKRRAEAERQRMALKGSCGRDREVPGDKLSTNLNRRKPVVTACLVCSKELQVEGVCARNDREERKRRAEAERQRMALKGRVPESWLRLPLTDAHAREQGKVLFFRGTHCLRGHLAPYRINGGCLACSGQKPSAHEN